MINTLKLNKMKKIVINTDKPFTFSNKITDEYGDFFILKQYQLMNFIWHIPFTLDDTCFIPVKKRFVTGLEFRQQVIDEKHIPLDVFCARAILEDREILIELKSKWWNEIGGIHNPNKLNTINFFGSMATPINDEKYLNILCFEYQIFSDKIPVLRPFEATDHWFENRDYAIVFKKEFIEKLIS